MVTKKKKETKLDKVVLRRTRKTTPAPSEVNSKRQMFTYSENKLLDQITTEVMEAWDRDLKMMKEVYKKVNDIITKMEIIIGNLRESTYSLNNMLNELQNKFANIVQTYNSAVSKRWWQFWK